MRRASELLGWDMEFILNFNPINLNQHVWREGEGEEGRGRRGGGGGEGKGGGGAGEVGGGAGEVGGVHKAPTSSSLGFEEGLLDVHGSPLHTWGASGPLKRKPYTLHPTPYTLHPTPYTLHPTP